jgi:hypothetical protein
MRLSLLSGRAPYGAPDTAWGAVVVLLCGIGCSSGSDQTRAGANTGGTTSSAGGTNTGGDATGGKADTGGGANSGGNSGSRNSGGIGGIGASSGAGGAGRGIGTARACDKPTVIHVSNGPQTSPEDTGFDMCGTSWVARRRVAKACPLGPTTTDLNQCKDNLCGSDADCTQSPHGFCSESRHLAGYCGCYYGCMQDSDCDPGKVCFCGTPVGHCVPSTCVDDSACGTGALCATYLAPCVPGQYASGGCTGGVNGCFSGFACQSAADECLYDDDCLPNNARCELHGDHRVCAPACPGPPPPAP